MSTPQQAKFRARLGRLVLAFLSLNMNHRSAAHAWSAAKLHDAVMVWTGGRDDGGADIRVQTENEAFQKMYGLLANYLFVERVRKSQEYQRQIVAELEVSLIARFGPMPDRPLDVPSVEVANA